MVYTKIFQRCKFFSDSFKYLCYASKAIINMFTLFRSRIDFIRQNLTSTDVRV